MFDAALLALSGFDLHAIEEAVRAARGWGGILIIFVYSFLIAFVLPLPSEVVLIPALSGSLALGLSYEVQVLVVMLASGLGKALGSVVALYLGHGASHSGPVIDAARRLGFEPMEWSRKRVVTLVQEYGYVGLALGLTVPGFPDTLSIYAFSVLEENYVKFSLATFAGSVGRLLVTLAVWQGFLAVV
ncbi:YqaA family protein [Halospeciosus flavus]|uniref:YqaA family protein n=1 Tax=Halospeciosus flavus TaxID=3032283 RepID=A0ABD5Z5D3_9EURY|nr:VTT domain-containing protein [Halospeciosus flavus]